MQELPGASKLVWEDQVAIWKEMERVGKGATRSGRETGGTCTHREKDKNVGAYGLIVNSFND